MRVLLPKDWDRRCDKCRSLLGYSNRYDALFCASCDAWCEERCTDPQCWAACSQRPEKPSGGDIDPAETQ